MVRRRTFLQAAAAVAAATAGAAASPSAAHAAPERPYLLLTSSDISRIGALRSSQPWATWAQAAAQVLVDPTLPTLPTAVDLGAISHCAKEISRQAGAASLAYVLATADGDAMAKARYKSRILDLIRLFRHEDNPKGVSPDMWDGKLVSDDKPLIASNKWQTVVPPASALFQLTLGLDVIYPELTTDERDKAHRSLESAANWYYSKRGHKGTWPDVQWQAARIGAFGIWAAFTGDRAKLAEAIQLLDIHLASYCTADGIYVDAPLYAADRLGSAGDRDSKSYFVDVLAHLRKVDPTWGKDYYTDPGYRATMEYYAGYLVTPVLRTGQDGIIAREGFTFGDSWASDSSASRSGRMYSAHRFGDVAAGNAAASLRGVGPERALPLLTTYVLCEQAPPLATAMVPSRVFPGVGAWFFDRGTTPSALSGALWCPGWRQPTPAVPFLIEAHHHMDTNALHLTAYGEHVLRNVGYAGWETGSAGMEWAQIQDTAAVNNVVVIDDQNHVQTTGQQRLPGTGIVDSLLWRDVDFACGDSGMALPKRNELDPQPTHKRSLIFLHPSGPRQGYWVVIDEVLNAPTTPTNAKASVYWHPNSTTVPAPAGAGYLSKIDIKANSATTVDLTVFPATAPSKEVTFPTSGLAEVSYSGNTHTVPPTSNAPALKVTYDTSGGAKSFVTVLVPSAGTNQPRPELQQISGPGYTGGRVAHPDGQTVDYALESQGDADVRTDIDGQGEATWRGRAAFVRMAGSSVEQYLLRRGRSFRWAGWGFTASQDVSANIRACGGKVRNNNTAAVEVTFFQPGLTAVAVNGVVPPGASATVVIPPGESTVALLTAPAFGAVADTYVQRGQTTSYGTHPTLIVKEDLNEYYKRETFLRFDLTGYAGGTVDAAYLVLYAEGAGGGACMVELVEELDNAWTEELKWADSDRPTRFAEPALGKVAAPAKDGKVAFDVSDRVNAMLTAGGPRVLSLRIRVVDVVDQNATNNSVTFASNNHPTVTCRPGLHLSI